MSIRILTLFAIIAATFIPTGVLAGEFDWMKDFNVQAEADESGVKLKIGASFKLNGADIDVVWSNTKTPADAFNVVALADISGRPVRDVLAVYGGSRNTGWGNMAKQLGIKPGSQAFKALKDGHYKNQSDMVSPGISIGISIGGGKQNNGNGKNK